MSRYEPLSRYLESRREAEAPLTFSDIERILNRSLPPSARLHQPWWANTASHSHAEAWLRVGWKTSQVDLAGQRVVFFRGRGERTSSRTEIAKLPDAEDQLVLRPTALSLAAHALLRRHMDEHGCSREQAVSDLLHQAAIDRRRQLLARFPLDGEPSTIDSVDLIREDRDAR